MSLNDLMKTLSFPHGVRAQATFIQNVISTFLVQILQLSSIIATAAIIARWLGPEGKGITDLTLLVLGILSLFLSGGIGVANVYFAGTAVWMLRFYRKLCYVYCPSTILGSLYRRPDCLGLVVVLVPGITLG
jgi:O-antigen/teichoic acid export membrane protein